MAPRFAGTPVEPATGSKPRFAGTPVDAAAPAATQRQMPNLAASMPGPVGSVLGLLGYDGRIVPENASMIPALDPINAAGAKLAESIPIVGPKLAEVGRNVDAGFASMVEGKPVTADERGAITTQEQENFPVATGAGQAAGVLLPLGALGATKLGGQALGVTGNVLQRTLAGGASGFGISGADALARGGTPEEAVNTALVGGALGGAAPLVAKGASMAWNGVRSALAGATGGVDDLASSELKSVARDMFQQSDAAGVKIDPASYDNFVTDVSAALAKGRVNPILSPKASAVLDELKSVGDEIAASGDGISLGEMHDLRQIAQSAAQGMEGRDQVLGSVIIDKLDDFLDGLTVADIGGAADPAQAVNSLQNAISTWHVARKAQTLEEAIYRAQNSASGINNGLKVTFRQILNNPKKREGFTPDEIRMIEEVANGTVGSNLLQLVGKYGFGGGNAGNMLGGTIGATVATSLGGPVAGVTAGLGASAARLGAQNLTSSAAQNALGAVTSKAGLPKGPTPTFLKSLAALNDAPVNLPFSPAALGAQASYGALN